MGAEVSAGRETRRDVYVVHRFVAVDCADRDDRPCDICCRTATKGDRHKKVAWRFSHADGYVAKRKLYKAHPDFFYHCRSAFVVRHAVMAGKVYLQCGR